MILRSERNSCCNGDRKIVAATPGSPCPSWGGIGIFFVTGGRLAVYSRVDSSMLRKSGYNFPRTQTKGVWR